MSTLELKEKAEQILIAGGTIDDVLLELRACGCSKAKAAFVVSPLLGNSTEAKEKVHFSPVWEDLRSRDEKFHDSLEKSKNEGQIG